MIRADEFFDSALALLGLTASVPARIHVILFLLYHAVELYLKCLGTYTYCMEDTTVASLTDPVDDDDDLETPDELFLSHSLVRAFERIPPSVRGRLVAVAAQRNLDIRKVIDPLPEAVNLFCRYHWTSPKHEKSLVAVPYDQEELVAVLRGLGRLLKSFARDERLRFI